MMTIDAIKRILDNHDVPNRIVSGRIFADSMIANQPTTWLDATEWSRSELAEWLGY